MAWGASVGLVAGLLTLWRAEAYVGCIVCLWDLVTLGGLIVAGLGLLSALDHRRTEGEHDPRRIAFPLAGLAALLLVFTIKLLTLT